MAADIHGNLRIKNDLVGMGDYFSSVFSLACVVIALDPEAKIPAALHHVLVDLRVFLEFLNIQHKSFHLTAAADQ